MSEPTPPDANSVSESSRPALKDAAQFRSDMPTKSERAKDYFAEQNQERDRKQAQRSKRIKRALIIEIPACTLLIGCVVVAIVLLNREKPVAVTTPEENQQTANTFYDQAIDKVNSSRPALTDPDASVLPSDSAVTEANEVFENAITEAMQDRNSGEADAIRVAQMLFYINVGTNYSKMIEIGEQVENVGALELQQQLQYYNIMANAYVRTGNEEKAIEYYAEASRIAELIGGDEEEGA